MYILQARSKDIYLSIYAVIIRRDDIFLDKSLHIGGFVLRSSEIGNFVLISGPARDFLRSRGGSHVLTAVFKKVGATAILSRNQKNRSRSRWHLPPLVAQSFLSVSD